MSATVHDQGSPGIGVELEMVAAGGAALSSHAAGPYFRRLAERRRARGLDAVLKRIGGRDVAVATGDVFSSIDNAFNNLESGIGPLTAGPRILERLDAAINAELAEVLAVLAEENATVLNFSEHPTVDITEEFYRGMRAPKPIYDYWVGHRGWRHSVGVDAKAQNGSNVDVRPHDAIRLLNVTLALAPAFIALYANSPFESGRLTGLKENRLTIWRRMFAATRFPGDNKLRETPARPFHDMRDYLSWTFGEGTAMHIVPTVSGLDYKGMADVVRIAGDPPLLGFLAGGPAPGVLLSTGADVMIEPSVAHLEFLQFSHFLDSRIRWRFRETPGLDAFWSAFYTDGGLEDLFAGHAQCCYVEFRATGANYADAALAREADEAVLASVAISPSALIYGLATRLADAESLVRRWGWTTLLGFRDEAIAQALGAASDGCRIADLCHDVLELATDALTPAERWMLAYPRHVLDTRKTGADRALSAFERGSGDERTRIFGLMSDRVALSPERIRAAAVA